MANWQGSSIGATCTYSLVFCICYFQPSYCVIQDLSDGVQHYLTASRVHLQPAFTAACPAQDTGTNRTGHQDSLPALALRPQVHSASLVCLLIVTKP